jgi:phage shock protein A
LSGTGFVLPGDAREPFDRRRDLCHQLLEDPARSALARKFEHEDLVRGLEAQYARFQQTSFTVRTAIRALEARLAEAQHKQRSLMARHRAVRARQEVSRFIGAGLPSIGLSQSRFESLASRLEDLEEELEAKIELTQGRETIEIEFLDREREEVIAREVADLRNQLQAEAEPPAD